jgi:hypothetical protein
MLGLGSNMMKHPVTGKSIVRDGLVLQHNYNLSSVEPLSSGAAYFDGDNDYIELGSQSGDLRLSGSNGSITAWVNPTVVGDDYQRIVDKSDGGDGANGYAFILHDDGTVQCGVDGSTAVSGLIVLTAQKWQHLAWTWDGTNHKLYVDGVLDVSNASSAKPPSDTTNMRIGTWSHTTAREYKGYMCNVGIFEEALSQAQVKSIMNKNYDSLSASEKTDLVSWWNLDSTIPGSATAVYDNHHGGGEILGADELTCGDFSCSDPTDYWTTISGTTEYSNDSLVLLPGGKIRQNSVTSAGNYYTVAYEVTENLGANLQYYNGSAYVTIPSTVGTHSFDFLRLGSDNNFYLNQNYAGASASLTISSISVKEINGNTGTLS